MDAPFETLRPPVGPSSSAGPDQPSATPPAEPTPPAGGTPPPDQQATAQSATGTQPPPGETPVAPEKPKTKAEIQAEIVSAWIEAVHFITTAETAGFWKTDDEAIRAYLKGYNIEISEENFAKEQKRRAAIIKTAEELRILDSVFAKVNAEIETFVNRKLEELPNDQATDEKAQEQARAKIKEEHAEEINAIRTKHYRYDENTEEYEIVGRSDHIASRSHVAPVLDGLADLASDTTQPERAANARIDLAVLLPFVNKTKTGIIPKTQEDFVKEKIRTLQKEAFELGRDVVEVLLEEQGEKITDEVRDKHGKLDLKKLTELEFDPNTKMGSLVMLLVNYTNLETPIKNVSPNAKGFLSSLIIAELRNLNLKDLSDKRPDLKFRERFQELTKLITGEEGGSEEYFQSQLIGLKNIMLSLAGFDPKETPMAGITPDKTFRVAYLALASERKLEKTELGLALPKEIRERIAKLKAQGEFSADEEKLILALAKEGAASSIFTRVLNFNLEDFQAKDASSLYARRVVEIINQGREARGEELLVDVKKTDRETLVQYNIEQTIASILKGRKVPGWLAAIGLLALILSPQISALLGSDAPTDEKT